MSIVFPCRRRDFLAPSKALQELKAKLGPIYFDAKLIECPQNAVELGKLLQKYEELDKQKFKKLSETSREQRLLQNSLSSRQKKEPSTVSLLSRGSSTRNFVDVTTRNTPPPGFRFHANGDPKSEGLDTMNDFSPDSRTSIASWTSTRESNTSTITEGDFRNGISDDDFDRDEATPTGSKSRDPEYEEIDYSKEIEDLETLILQLEAQLISSKLDKPSAGANVDQPKRNYLRAHSHSEDVLESCINRPSANYAYDPDQKHKRNRRPTNPMFGPGIQSDVKRCSKCLACQFKLKHVGNEFSKHSKPDVMKARWNAAPSGCFISSPNISATSTISLPGSRLESKRSLIAKKSSTPLLPTTSESCQTSKTSARRSADRTVSLTSSKASSKDLLPAASSPSCGSPLRRFLSPLQRESRMQMLRSQAEQDVRDCQEKVDSFLGHLDSRKSVTRTKHWWEAE